MLTAISVIDVTSMSRNVCIASARTAREFVSNHAAIFITVISTDASNESNATLVFSLLIYV
ncbi:hypothetical protein JCM14467A_11330 [Vulcanisaeta sp. JCM 14467]